MIDLEN